MPIQKKLKMNHREVTVSIDSQKCTGCGSCITVCPSGTIALTNGIAQITGESSLNCGHCMAICPESAITVDAIEPQSICFETFELNHKYLAPGVAGIQELARIIASRFLLSKGRCSVGHPEYFTCSTCHGVGLLSHRVCSKSV